MLTVFEMSSNCQIRLHDKMVSLHTAFFHLLFLSIFFSTEIGIIIMMVVTGRHIFWNKTTSIVPFNDTNYFCLFLSIPQMLIQMLMTKRDWHLRIRLHSKVRVNKLLKGIVLDIFYQMQKERPCSVLGYISPSLVSVNDTSVKKAGGMCVWEGTKERMINSILTEKRMNKEKKGEWWLNRPKVMDSQETEKEKRNLTHSLGYIKKGRTFKGKVRTRRMFLTWDE